jgi:hypothetical protein
MTKAQRGINHKLRVFNHTELTGSFLTQKTVFNFIDNFRIR